MKKKSIGKTLLSCAIVLLMLVTFNQLALTKKVDPEKKDQLIIYSILVNFVDDDILFYIEGRNFDKGDTPGVPPTVTIDGVELAVEPDFTPTYMVAKVAGGLEDGDYLMMVYTGDKVEQFDKYNLTIGAVGPKGDMPGHQWSGTGLAFENPDGTMGTYVDLKGEKGDTGKPGDKGDQGPQGEPGAQGPKGDMPGHQWSGTGLAFENPDGTMGPYVDLEGERGAQGPAGADGVPGADANAYVNAASVRQVWAEEAWIGARQRVTVSCHCQDHEILVGHRSNITGANWLGLSIPFHVVEEWVRTRPKWNCPSPPSCPPGTYVKPAQMRQIIDNLSLVSGDVISAQLMCECAPAQ